MKFYPLPKFPCPPEQLAEFRKFANLPTNIAAYPSQQVVAGTIPAAGSAPKPWRDNATIWQPSKQTFEYFVIRGAVELKLRTVAGDAGTPVTDAEGIGQLEGAYSMYAIAFYNRRFIQSGGKEFSRIPRIVKIEMDRAEAQRMNILTPPSAVDVEWPIAVPTGDAQWPSSIAPKCALRFNGNAIEAFDVDEYDREFPLVIGAVSDEELIGAVEAILSSPMSAAEKAKAIRMVAR